LCYPKFGVVSTCLSFCQCRKIPSSTIQIIENNCCLVHMNPLFYQNHQIEQFLGNIQYYKKMWISKLEELTKKYPKCHCVQLDQNAIYDFGQVNLNLAILIGSFWWSFWLFFLLNFLTAFFTNLQYIDNNYT
jgi:hypothetical protein